MSDLPPSREVLSLLSDLGEIDSEIKALETQKAEIRTKLAIIVASEYQDSLRVPGYGSLIMTSPSRGQRWNAKALTELVQSLRETGNDDLANEIESCKASYEIAGGLTIRPEKSSG